MAKLFPAVALRGLVQFPGMISTLTVGRGASVAALDAHLDHHLDLVLVLQRDAGLENPGPEDVHPVGVLARALRTLGMPDGGVRVLFEVLDRVTVRDFAEHPTYGFACTPVRFVTQPGDPKKVEAAEKRIREVAVEIFGTNSERPPELDSTLALQQGPERLADHLAPQLGLAPEEAQELLAEPALEKRLERLLWFVERAREYSNISQRVAKDVQAAMDTSQREYFLREQLKAIQKELGETVLDEIAEYDAKIAKAGMPEEIEKEARRELDRLKRIHVDAAEYMVARTYLDWLVAMPWQVETTDATDLRIAKQVLDEDHHGLEKVKERILEFLAVRQLKADAKGPILCFVGPPGVGKTSLGKSIARALGRKVERIALGGMKDEAEIRGHRRTYVGALPGRVVQALKRAGTRNPVIILDELDKIGSDFRGDPASALLEVLDPEQNHAFRDHYLDAPFDLSRVLFIGTANVEDPIPAALHDRLEVISIPGYIEEDKLAIAKNHLTPRLLEQNGIPVGQLVIPEQTVEEIIRGYTREAGVRNLERELSALYRKTARKMVEGEREPIVVTIETLVKWQGPPKFHTELAERTSRPGIAIGLAWTEAGGDILFIEATKMVGPRGLKLTGSLGNVMKESCEAAMSFVREQAPRLGIDSTVFGENEFHLHMPAGAIPKDGPSAGVTMYTALVSLLTGRPVKPNLAMTGEITLRGKVLPVGGIKEKVLAARRAGITDIVLPKQNERDLLDVPQVLRDQLRYHLVENADEVLELGLMPVEPKAEATAS
ncbi:MAG: endopeptidase La [Pseudomonadota bacterium]|nr:endopeptidase La [Pseudomonadota bacterium]